MERDGNNMLCFDAHIWSLPLPHTGPNSSQVGDDTLSFSVKSGNPSTFLGPE
jgi:hypothetical protein